MKKGYIEKRAEKLGEYIVRTDSTIRGTAEHYGLHHAMVFEDVRKRLPEINTILADLVDEVMERHIRNRECIKYPYPK